MTLPGRAELKELVARPPAHCVSVFLPTHPVGGEAQQDVVRLKNLVNEAEQLLVDHGLRSADARSSLAAIRELPGDAANWARRDAGLAIFVSPDFAQHWTLPYPVDETVVVRRRFCIKPLIQGLDGDSQYYVLAVSQKLCQLYRADRFSIAEVDVPIMPPALELALNLDGAEPRSQVHSGARGGTGKSKQSAVFHGQGGERDTAKDELAQYLRLVEEAVRRPILARPAPVVLAGVEYVATIFRRQSHLPGLLEATAEGNPDLASPKQLQTATWPLVQGVVQAAREDAWARFARWNGTGKAADDPSQVVRAAVEGRIDSLFANPQATISGEYDAASGEITVHPEPRREADDLVDLVIAETLRHDGTIYPCSADLLPTRNPLAAVFRYG